MNDKDTDLVNRPADETPFVGADAATLVPVVADADGKLVAEAHDGDRVEDGEVVAYVQTDEDA